MILNLTDYSTEPLHRQIAAQITQRIVGGDYGPGEALPMPRSIARRERISVRSVERAYRNLEQDGWVRRDNEGAYVVDSAGAGSRERRLQADDVLESFEPEELRSILSDLLKAQDIQANLLPRALPVDERISMAGYSKPSRTVGGDFYDWVPLGEDRFAIVIADASGKGLPAAMLIARIHAMVRSELKHATTIGAALESVNDHLNDTTDMESFVTLFMGIFDRRSGVFEYVNAGHNFPVLVRSGGGYELLETGGLLLGIAPGQTYPTASVTLSPGDFLCFFTDGVTETTNDAGDEYGERRLIDTLQEVRHLDAQGVIETVLADLCQFENARDDAPLSDDRTVVVLRANYALSN